MNGSPRGREEAGDHDDRWGRDPYRRKRRALERRRSRVDRERGSEPPTDDDFTVEDDEGLQVVPAPSPLADVLGGVVRSRGWEAPLRGAELQARWVEIVGADLARRCEPVRFAGGTLVVRAENQTWATQLRYMTREIVARAESVLGGGSVREVRITVGPLEEGHA